MILTVPVLAEGQWILSAVVEDTDQGIPGELYTTSISNTIGEIKITKAHQGTEGYRPYTQNSIMTWSPLPTTAQPGETLEIQLTVADGGSTLEYRNSGILSLTEVGERDYDFIASKYRGLELTAIYTMPQGSQGDELVLKIEGSMGAKDLPSAVYFYTYTFTKDAVEVTPIDEALGSVTLNTRDVVLPVVSGTLMKPGDVVLTGGDGKMSLKGADLDNDSAAGITDKGSLVLLMGRVHVTGQLEVVIPASWGDPGDEYLIYRLKTTMEDLSNESLLAVVTSAGESTIQLNRDGTVELSVLHGSAQFATGEQTVTVREGETMVAPVNGNPEITAGFPRTRWWIETANNPGEIQGSPAFGMGIGLWAMVLALFLRR